jgi:mitogen-activated protein kinase kinase
LSFASQYGIGGTKNQGDPVSAVGSLYSNASEGPGSVGMEREGSLPGLEGFDKLSLERAMAADVEDLDDEGWRIASAENRIEEIGSLGEGAGGAVTKCKLRGGKTIFALKVCGFDRLPSVCHASVRLTRCHRSSQPTQTPT